MALIKGKTGIACVPVSAVVTDENGEPLQTVAFTVHFRRLGYVEDCAAMSQLVLRPGGETDPAAGFGILHAMLAQLRETVVGWDGLAGDDGEEVPFSADTLEAMLFDDGYFAALRDGFFEARSQRARAKN